MVRFCPDCQSYMNKTTASGDVKYRCSCSLEINGTAEDTLMAEGVLESSKMTMIHEVFMENSPHDPAGLKVAKTCPKCGLDFLTQIYVGIAYTSVFTCSCGYRATYTEHTKNNTKQESKTNE